MILVGTVITSSPQEAAIQPESILKGSVAGSTLSLSAPLPSEAGICVHAPLNAGQRVLLLLDISGGVPRWPGVDQVYYLVDGRAESANPSAATSFRESDLMDLVTGETDQVVVPASSETEGQGIEWGTTVLPIGAALVIVFVIGLFLMRIWHRIDPS